MTTNVVGVCERVQHGCWRDYRDDVTKLNPRLAEIIDEIDPESSHRIYRVTYSYGDRIYERPGFYLPSNDEDGVLLSEVGGTVCDDLGYSYMPLTFVLYNSAELYSADDNYVMPVNVFVPGDMFAVYESLSMITNMVDVKPSWSISAGISTVCLLGKISNAVKHQQLRVDYGASLPLPRSLLEQRFVMRKIGRNSNWRCELLMFSGRWLDHTQDKAWMPFYDYLFKIAWYQMRNVRNESRFEELWDSDRFSKYVNETAKRIIVIASSYYPGMTVVNDREWLLPARFLESVYLDKYRLDYAPVLMGPAFLGNESYESKTVYYSGNYNVLYLNDGGGRSSNLSVGFKELERLCALFCSVDGFVKNSKGDGLIGHNINIMSGDVVFVRFFYGGTAATGGALFLNSCSLGRYDSDLESLLHGRLSGYGLPAFAAFLRSCVQISIQ